LGELGEKETKKRKRGEKRTEPNNTAENGLEIVIPSTGQPMFTPAVLQEKIKRKGGQ